MNQEELLSFLREHLSISLSLSDGGSGFVDADAYLLLDGVAFSCSSDSIQVC